MEGFTLAVLIFPSVVCKGQQAGWVVDWLVFVLTGGALGCPVRLEDFLAFLTFWLPELGSS